ncbi:unnamed protein product [Pleuronectes platessa]|uniref:Uncharacterized protein n=1 Tax=Pleuronectes platessa TaxID=8262 RepID=A0A9N7UZF9_PLEPL|nr:unnamed protein product [Pleuronectes platessa]
MKQCVQLDVAGLCGGSPMSSLSSSGAALLLTPELSTVPYPTSQRSLLREEEAEERAPAEGLHPPDRWWLQPIRVAGGDLEGGAMCPSSPAASARCSKLSERQAGGLLRDLSVHPSVRPSLRPSIHPSSPLSLCLLSKVSAMERLPRFLVPPEIPEEGDEEVMERMNGWCRRLRKS